ncbi:putative major facilitator superfamily, MFS transporter superfamily [Septoria linicola]|nr:putative major facilitator superfamily, MFS transporter superfamily [Septoria linicola]
MPEAATSMSAAIKSPDEIHEKAESICSGDTEPYGKAHRTNGDLARETDGNDLTRKPSATPSEQYPEGKEVVLVMIAILLAVFLMALDRTIIATAVPQITNEFNSLDDMGWYASAFMLTASCFQLPLGKVYGGSYSPKTVFLVLIGVFEIGSVICGAAPNSVTFIIGRAIAGIGSAGIMSGAIILVVSIVPLAKRPKYQGFFGAVFGLSSVIEPLLGGAFTTNVSWRWCFYINLPIGGVATLVIFFILKPTPPVQPGLTVRQQLLQLDLLGEAFLLPSIICLLLALQWGGATYAWSDGRIIALFVVFGVALIGFVLVQIFKPETATIPARIIKNRSIVSGMLFVFCLASAMMIFVYYIALYFQASKGTTAVQSGINTIPMVLSLVVGSIFSGQMISRLGYYTPFAMAGSMLMPIGAGLITTWNTTTSSGYWIGYQVVLGLGIGIGMQQGGMAAQTVLARKDVPIGVSLMFFMQQLGGAIFVSVGQNVFNSSLISGLVRVVKDLDPMTIVNTGATDIRRIVPEEELASVLIVYNTALRQVFIVGVILAALSVLGSFSLEWRSVKGKQGPTEKKSNDSAQGPAETEAKV